MESGTRETAVPQGGVELTATGAIFTLWSGHASAAMLCLFDESGRSETLRVPMPRGEDGLFRCHVEGVREGTRYGYRLDGDYRPDKGLWFDPAKLLVDPYAKAVDRPFVYDARLATFGADTAPLMPKAVVTADRPVKWRAPMFRPGGLVYEVAVKAFTELNPDVPEGLRGTVAALAHPSIIAHLKRIGVDAVELMPLVAWIDERHLGPLGLTNAWGYNPVAFMPLDPRICPGGMDELRDTVAALHAEGIGVLLDLVFNHTGESDRHGPTLSLRGVDNFSLYRHVPDRPDVPVNDTGCGHTVSCDHPYLRHLIIDSLRHFVVNAGVDGFRFDLATVLFRDGNGFQADGPMLDALRTDPVLSDRILIAEPWDIGPGGYQLGHFAPPFLEWNDRARDGMRRYWRGDQSMTGSFATVLAGSSDLFARDGQAHSRSVNFIAAHDGFTLMDLVSHEAKHNEANGEHNRDGHNDNHSWNNGAEGETANETVIARRRQDVKALLSTLFLSNGTIMLTMGDEAGRSQRGNNNAYCQDNALIWFDWSTADHDLIAHTGFLSRLRKRFSRLSTTAFYKGDGDILWLSPAGRPMNDADWHDPGGAAFGLAIATPDAETGEEVRLVALFNRAREQRSFHLPDGLACQPLGDGAPAPAEDGSLALPPRSVTFYRGAI